MRKASLARLLARRVDGIFLSDFEQGKIGPDLFRHACLMGLEGLLSKHRENTYRAGRFLHGIKVKNRQHPAGSRVLDQFAKLKLLTHGCALECGVGRAAMCHNRKWTVLLNHLVGERQQGRGHGYAKLFSGLQIDHPSKLARLLDRKIAGLGAAKNFRNIGARMAPAVQKVT